MKTYKIEMVQVSKKYANITIMAENRSSAIDKARDMEWEAFHEVESSEQTSWTAQPEWKFFGWLISLLTRKDYE